MTTASSFPDQNPPRKYDLTDPAEVQRLMREVRGYLQTCYRQNHGTDKEGRGFALEAMNEIVDGPQIVVLEIPE
jgi:hypothetical protein